MKNIFLALLVTNCGLALGDVKGERFFIGTSAFMVMNLDQEAEDPPHFYQFNLGYQLTKKDVVSIEFLTWRYYAPLGISAIENANDNEKFPGYVSAQGAALAYQRFLWRGSYTALHAAWFDQKYLNPEGVKLGSGNQLFLTFRLGWHFSFFSDHFFIEPNAAVTHWPINTNLPQDFQAQEDKWRKYQFEPGFHVGFVF